MVATTIVLFLSACSYTPDQRVWTDIAYPTQSVQLEIVDRDSMSKKETEEIRTVLAKTLNDLKIEVSPTAGRKLIVEVVKYNEQSVVTTALQWIIQTTFPGPWAFYSNNALDLRARLIKEDGSVVEFTKLAEISESGRDFKYLQENMARRVAYAVLTADALANAHERGYDKVSANKE
ncbi:MAG: hypothetical protein NT108_02705 [Candidatus Kaiserbacteria bacterium]|nr:hypothetical protein [Candidatus Kaiserbacteria bacterium]